MNAMKEIRWHGRAGQGAKSIAQILGLALMKSGSYVQAFPEYGPERSGAPVQAYTRVSDRPIRIRFGITEPDTVVVIDDSLVREVPVLDGLPPDGVALINTAEESPAALGLEDSDRRIHLIDAGRIAAEAGAKFANVVMMGSLAGVRGEPPLEAVVAAVCESFGAKQTEAVLEANLAAIRAGYSESTRSAVGGRTTASAATEERKHVTGA